MNIAYHTVTNISRLTVQNPCCLYARVIVIAEETHFSKRSQAILQSTDVAALMRREWIS